MRIAIIGAGPAGSRAAELLATQGHAVRLFDAHGPWEKPCGGGLTSRSLLISEALGDDLPGQNIDRISVYYGDTSMVTVSSEEPLMVVSRKQLGEHLLARALAAGTAFVRSRVTAVESRNGLWKIQTGESEFDADMLIGADGATSLVRRRVSTPLGGEDLSVTLGYFVRGRTDSKLKIFFVPDLEGYLWSFPRPDHISYGLITRPSPNWTARGKALLENYLQADLGPEAMDDARFYSAHVPRLRPKTWATNAVIGKGWALVGDAAGLVDPITGEGIYYALRSAGILSETFPDLDAYNSALRSECFRDLERASELYDFFYSGRFLGGPFRKRLVQFAHHSPTVRKHIGRLISGAQPYRGLRRTLLKSSARVACELLAAPFRNGGREMPQERIGMNLQD